MTPGIYELSVYIDEKYIESRKILIQ